MGLQYELVISNGYIAYPEVGRKNIGIIKGRIEIITQKQLQGDVVLDATDKIVLPEIVDVHVHDRTDRSHKWDHKEDHITASRAAANGGVGSYGVQPNTPDPCVDASTYQYQLDLSKQVKTTRIPYIGLHESTTLDTLLEVKRLGCHHAKGFTDSVGSLNMHSWDAIKKQRQNAYQAGLKEIWHAEDFEVLERIKRSPDYSKLSHCDKRSGECETSAAKRLIALGNTENLDFPHVTSEDMLRLVLSDSNGPLELTPHHLLLDQTMLHDDHAEYQIPFERLYQMNPPLRKESDRKHILLYMTDSKICHRILNGSDHAPHTLDEKRAGMSGVPQLDTTANVLCELNKRYGLKWENLGRIYCSNPAEYLGLSSQGIIAKGFDASLTLLDMTPTTIKTENLYTKCGWSPFSGKTFAGYCCDLIHKGEFLKKDGKVLI